MNVPVIRKILSYICVNKKMWDFIVPVVIWFIFCILVLVCIYCHGTRESAVAVEKGLLPVSSGCSVGTQTPVERWNRGTQVGKSELGFRI